MSLRRRRFDSTPDDDYNPTNYDEKYVIPTNGGAEFQNNSFLNAPSAGSQLYTAPTYKNEAASAYGVNPAPTAVEAPESPKPMIGEQPMVFALRSDPNLYVYEFTDRLEYYRNTPGGMLLCNIENKRR